MEPLDISRPSQNFEAHLNLEGNERTIFSGIFGAGKTYFLRSFFREHPRYVSLFINPTHYSIAQNQDIFELIKYDVLYQIILKKPYLEKIKASDLQTVPFLKFSDTVKVLEPFVSGIAQIGELLTDAAESILRLKTLLEEKKNSIETDEGRDIAHFIDQLERTKGSIYENDIYSKIIADLVLQIRRDGKSVILVVDDLDRIDPEHIFRILNVFAAHFRSDELKDTGNKFGVDKVILCCDVQNIRAIFKSKYGMGVDFNGYIDKFYSTDIFHFNNRTVIIDSVVKLLLSIKVEQKKKPLHAFLDPNTYYFKFLVLLIGSLILADKLNLRTLKKLYCIEYDMPMYSIHFDGGRIKNWVIPIIAMFDFLSFLFRDAESAVLAMKATDFMSFHPDNATHPDYRLSEDSFFNLFCEVIAILENSVNKFEPSNVFLCNTVTKTPIPYRLIPNRVNSMQYSFEPHLLGSLASDRAAFDSAAKGQMTLELFQSKFVDAFQLYIRARRATFNKL